MGVNTDRDVLPHFMDFEALLFTSKDCIFKQLTDDLLDTDLKQKFSIHWILNICRDEIYKKILNSNC